jgi:hypothetical protein
LLVATLLLEIEHEADVGQLQHVDRVGARLALRQHLGVERAGLQAQIFGADLRECLVERVEQLRRAALGIGRVEHDLAVLLRLGDIGAALEARQLHRRGTEAVRPGGRGARQRHREQSDQALHDFLPALRQPTRASWLLAKPLSRAVVASSKTVMLGLVPSIHVFRADR